MKHVLTEVDKVKAEVHQMKADLLRLTQENKELQMKLGSTPGELNLTGIISVHVC